jgi:transcriptional regulator with XRE-family HTH domain
MAEPAELGRLLRGFRHAAGLTLEEMAHRSGVSVRAISDMERGRSRSPHARTLTALAATLRLNDADRRLLLAASNAAPTPPAPAAAPRCELPPDTPDFTGRPAELDRVASWITELPGAAIPVVLSGVGGLGKTALAVHAAYRTREHFPDGRLFVDLGGSSAEPLDSHLVQFRLLRTLGLGVEDIPEDYLDRRHLLRHVLGERRMLLVLDDAADEAQIRGLLPGNGGTTALVTARRALTGLEHSRRIPLTPLTAGDAEGMLRAVVEAGGATVEDDADLRTVARLCGHHPLALRIAGNRVLGRPGWGLGALVEWWADEGTRLDRLTAGDLRVADAFVDAYDRLDPAARLLFRRLVLVPGRDVGPQSAAVASGLPRPDAVHRLDDLVELGLLAPAPGQRARFDELVRLFARQRLRAEESAEVVAEATARLMSWLLATARTAALVVADEGRTTEAEFPDPAAARRWLEVESGAWRFALTRAAEHGDRAAVAETRDALRSALEAGHADSSRWAELAGITAAPPAAMQAARDDPTADLDPPGPAAG